MRSHNILSLEELNNPEAQLKTRSPLHCTKHEGKILEYYCETCKELSCIHCMVLNHLKQDHSCMAVSEVAQKHREALQSSCTTLDEKISEGKEALNTICEVMKSLETNAQTTKGRIKEQKENILKFVIERLNKREEEMNQNVDEVCGELHAELSKQHDEMKESLDKVQGSMTLPRNLLKRGSIEEILSSQKVIDENIEKLRKDQSDNLTPLNDGAIEYVPEVIDECMVDVIVRTLGYIASASVAGLRSSSILGKEIALMKQLEKWMRGKCKWNLCYRASRDGWSASDFHRCCDNKGPTVVLVKANNCIFGGFTDQSWEGNKKWKRSHSSFIFSLRNKDNLAPFIANMKQAEEHRAIYCSSGYGPSFGGGHDLHICNKPHGIQNSYSNAGCTYQLPPSFVYGSEEAENLLAGQYEFITTEIEVFN